MMSSIARVHSVRQILRLTYGLIPIAAGLDKFFNLLTTWDQYVSPSLAQRLPFSPAVFMQIVGIIEIAAGFVVLSRFTRLGAYVVSAWLTVIALSLILSGRYLDVAVRDIAMALGAYTLSVLNEVIENSRTSKSAQTTVDWTLSA